MVHFKIPRAPFQSLRWRLKKFTPVNALMNEDTGFIVITTLKSLPFRSHADLLKLSFEELLVIAGALNTRLPLALQINVCLGTTLVELRHNIEFIMGYRRSAPDAMKIPFSIESVARKSHSHTRHLSPKTPASPLAMKRNAYDIDISILGRPRSSNTEEEELEADRSEIVMDSFASHIYTPSRPQSATFSGQSCSMLSPTTTGRTRDRPYASVTPRRSTNLEHQNRTSDFVTTGRLDRSRSSCRPMSSTPISTRNSPRPPTIPDMDLLVSTMMSLSPAGPARSPARVVSVGEFGVL